MPAARVVPTFDPGEDGHARLSEGLPGAPVDELALQAGEEALGHGVVVRIAHAPHRRSHAHLLAALAKVDAGVLGEFNQYASAAHQALLAKHSLVGSMSREGKCWDKSVMERFFLNLKMERV